MNDLTNSPTPGLLPLLLGVREPCSRLSHAKPGFACRWSEAWLPTNKAPAWLAHSKRRTLAMAKTD